MSGQSYTLLPIVKLEASSDDGSHGVDNLKDKSLGPESRWSGFGKGQFIIADLGALYMVHNVDIAFYRGDQRRYNLVIQTSADKKTFAQVLNAQSRGGTLDPERFDFPDVRARYVKIVFNGSNVSDWNSVTEVQIFGIDAPIVVLETIVLSEKNNVTKADEGAKLTFIAKASNNDGSPARRRDLYAFINTTNSGKITTDDSGESSFERTFTKAGKYEIHVSDEA